AGPVPAPSPGDRLRAIWCAGDGRGTPPSGRPAGRQAKGQRISSRLSLPNTPQAIPSPWSGIMATVETPAAALETRPAVAPALPWRVWLLALCVLPVYLPLLVAHARQLWLRPHYQFFPVVLAGAAILGWQRLQGIKHLAPGSRGLSYGLVALAGTLLA